MKVIVKDVDVFHEWEHKDSGETAVVSPDWYEENGTPIASDGDDMQYVCTRVNIPELEILNALHKSCKTVGMFYTPETKEEFEDWINLQCKGNPRAGVYAMVGFNYAMRQVQRILAKEE